jgi:hypothetical protein
VEFPYDTQFIFRSLIFAAGEDGNLELLTRGPASRHPVSVYGITPYYPIDPSTSGGACSCLNPHVGLYYLSLMTSQGLPIRKTIFQSTTGTSSSSSLGPTPDRDSIEDYLEISGVPTRTLPLRPAALAWWVQPGGTLRIVPVGTRLSGDLKRPMRGHPAPMSFRI